MVNVGDGSVLRYFFGPHSSLLTSISLGLTRSDLFAPEERQANPLRSTGKALHQAVAPLAPIGDGIRQVEPLRAVGKGVVKAKPVRAAGLGLRKVVGLGEPKSLENLTAEEQRRLEMMCKKKGVRVPRPGDKLY